MYLQHYLVDACLCHMKLLQSQSTFWIHHTTTHHFAVCLFNVGYIIIYGLAVTCHLCFGQNGQDVYMLLL